jgi:ferric-dicitrate binding protein FerR (iron transport regulator)
MEQELLHKMFRGKATDQELASIRQWVNADQANRKAFFRERTFYDALQLSKKATANKPSARKTFIWSWSQTVAAAAVISSLPIMIIFMCLQRFIQNGLVAGGVKG